MEHEKADGRLREREREGGVGGDAEKSGETAELPRCARAATSTSARVAVERRNGRKANRRKALRLWNFADERLRDDTSLSPVLALLSLSLPRDYRPFISTRPRGGPALGNCRGRSRIRRRRTRETRKRGEEGGREGGGAITVETHSGEGSPPPRPPDAEGVTRVIKLWPHYASA